MTEVVKHPDVAFVIGGILKLFLQIKKTTWKNMSEDLLKWECDAVVSLMQFSQQFYDY